MSKSNPMGKAAVKVDGIRYDEFASVKWERFLKFFLVIIALVVIAMLASFFRSGSLPIMSLAAVAIFVLLALFLFRRTLKVEYRASGFAELKLEYQFDKKGWTVRRGKDSNRVDWKDTWKIRKNRYCLMLYPNRKSVNLIPLRNIRKQDLEDIGLWSLGKTDK